MKGFEGNIAVVPETNGWGSNVYSVGNYLNADSESLTIGQEFKDRPDKLVYGRGDKPNSRTKGAQKPGGDVEFQFRSDDCLPILMAHFQKYIGSTLGGTATGTVLYTFVPTRTNPDWVGSTFGTGEYTSSSGDGYTVGVIKKFKPTSAGTDNAQWFSSCIVDQLGFNLDADEDAKFTPSFKSYSVDEGTRLAVDPPNAVFGSYSEKSAFDSFSGTLSIGGKTTFKVTSFSFTSANNSEDRSSIGYINPQDYDFGKYGLTGVMQIDAPNDALSHIGSMVADKTFAITGTLFNSINDQVTINMPYLRYDPFDVNLAGGNAQTEYGLPFKAFESQNGSTAPIIIKVRTTGMGSAFTKS